VTRVRQSVPTLFRKNVSAGGKRGDLSRLRGILREHLECLDRKERALIKKGNVTLRSSNTLTP